jgi:hypothetical protein
MIFLNSFLQAAETSENKTVFLTILARNKGHILPQFLNCIENLDYNKKLITVYINTNDNHDKTKEMLEDWMKKNESQYKRIIFENHTRLQTQTLRPHEWSVEQLSVLAAIRNKSLEIAKKEKTDFYFVVDCDNFITPCTLKELIKKDKPIIAPLLKPIPLNPESRYSNFFAAVTKDGYFANHPDYDQIRLRKVVGTFKVPVVHCTYLIKSEYLNQLSYIDESDEFEEYEFVVFSKDARKKNIDQYICNEKNFGLLLHFVDGEDFTLEEECKKVKEKNFQEGLSELKTIYPR